MVQFADETAHIDWGGYSWVGGRVFMRALLSGPADSTVQSTNRAIRLGDCLHLTGAGVSFK
jgi:hypothetical protein